MAEANKKKSDTNNTVYQKRKATVSNYLLIFGLVNFFLFLIFFTSLYFLYFVKIKEIKADLNKKLNIESFQSEKNDMERLILAKLSYEKQYLVSKISSINDSLLSSIEDLEKKIKNIKSDNLKQVLNPKPFQGYTDTEKLEEQIQDFSDRLFSDYKKDLDVLKEKIKENRDNITKIATTLSDFKTTNLHVKKEKPIELTKDFIDLIDDFANLTYKVLRNDFEKAEGDTWLENFKIFFKRIFISRSIEPIEGQNLDAILSRIDNALKTGRLKTAKIEVKSLPYDARVLMEDWVAKLDIIIEKEQQRDQ